jgi:hypothetical protein
MIKTNYMQTIAVQEILFLLILFVLILILFNTISFFKNRQTFRKYLLLSLKWAGIIFLIMLALPIIIFMIARLLN